MQFCPDCESILLPKRGSKDLYCKVCEKVIKIKSKSKTKKSIKIDKKIIHKIPIKTKVFTKKSTKSISDEDRRAMEDYYFQR